MNEITKIIVTDCAKTWKSLVVNNPDKFKEQVRYEYWEYMINNFGYKIKNKMLRRLRLNHPDIFGDDGFLIDDPYNVNWNAFDFDRAVSGRAARILQRRMRREKALQLQDWGDLPQQIAKPQMGLGI